MNRIIKKAVYGLFSSRFIRKGIPGYVYITYDDGPHPENTEVILNILARHGAKATFFMVGSQMEQFPELVNAVIRAGHSIGYHSYRHQSLKNYTLREIREDLAHARELSRKFRCPIRLYRPPYGDLSIVSFLWLLINGWKIVMWSLDCRDSFETMEQVKANITPDKLIDGEIILFHEDYIYASELIEATLQLYQDSGLICRQL